MYSQGDLTKAASITEASLLDFIKTELNSFIKWDLVQFFYTQTEIMDSSENIARHLGRKKETVELELEDLVEKGILTKHGLDLKPLYAVAQNKEIASRIHQFILAHQDRHFRLKAIAHLIRGMR